jgi:hypothetical protein
MKMGFALLGAAALAAVGLGSPARAADFDGEQSLFCVSMQVFECHADQGCVAVPSEEYGTASKFLLDFQKKTLDTVIDTPDESKIQRVEKVNDKLYVQGIDRGAAWSFAISEPDGLMVATIAKGDGTAFVLEGFCKLAK